MRAAVLVLAWVSLFAPAAPPTQAQHRAADSTSFSPSRTRGRFPFLHHRHRGKPTRRAQADTVARLQVELGYDGNFHAPDLRRDQTTTASVIFMPLAGFEAEVDVDVWAEQLQQYAMAGHGDIHTSLQWTFATSRQRSFALTYGVTMPTASQGLGTGYWNHQWLVPFSASLGALDLDLHAGVDADGRAGGLSWGLDGAGTVTWAMHPRLASYLGWSGNAVDAAEPAGHYVNLGASWQVSRTMALDLSARVGLSAGAPAYGVTAGLTHAAVSR